MSMRLHEVLIDEVLVFDDYLVDGCPLNFLNAGLEPSPARMQIHPVRERFPIGVPFDSEKDAFPQFILVRFRAENEGPSLLLFV